MTLVEITSKKQWEDCVSTLPLSPFVQSWDWGELNRAEGHRVVRLGFVEKGNIVCGAQLIVKRLPFGRHYAYVPFGPVCRITPTSYEYTKTLLEFLRALTAKRREIFIRIEPRIETCFESQLAALRSEIRLEYALHGQVRDTRVLSLTKTEDELLNDMHHKTRYNIRLAERKGVIVRTGATYIEDFFRLNHETVSRDNFLSHPDSHYQNMIDVLPDGMLTVYAAEYHKKIIAVNLVVSYGDTTTYVHGASSSIDREVMAPHLLQWQQIRDAKQQGRTYYDFWGIAPRTRPSVKAESWKGITRFKNGFGGGEKNFVDAYDLPIQPLWYSLYTVVRRLR